MQTTSVYACVRILAETIASLLLHTYKDTEMGRILRQLCEHKKVEIIEANACKDHIHMLVSSKLKVNFSLRPSRVVNTIQGTLNQIVIGVLLRCIQMKVFQQLAQRNEKVLKE